MKAGDRVICIDADSHKNLIQPKLIKGREYIIYASKKCSCGLVKFDIGATTNKDYIRCECGRDYSSQGTHWANSKRFAKIKEQYKVVHMDIETKEPILN